MRLMLSGGEGIIKKLGIKPKGIHLETERLILRPLNEKDSEGVYQNVREYDIAKWTINIPHPYPKDGAISFIKRSIDSMKKGLSYELAVELKTNSALVGVMSLMKVDTRHRNAELGYWVGKSHWNSGIATEAASRIMEFGFNDLNLERIFAKCFENNNASRRVMEKIGMKYEGKFRHEVFKENRFIDLIYFAIIKKDWEEHR